jgi:hypothetical protein
MRSIEFTEDTLGTNPKRAPRTGTRHSRGHEPVPRYRSTDEDKQKGVDGKACWDGYKRMGTKQKGGKTVDNCVKVGESASDSAFRVGDPVIITGNVEYQGKTGDVREIGRDGAFVVVDLYNYGPYSFHTSDVSYNDYADQEDDEEGVAEQEKVGNMPADKFDDAMARLKRLAGAGPLKTVYDPAKRVYRNVPTAVQPKK